MDFGVSNGLCGDCAIRSYNFSLSGKLSFFFAWGRAVDLRTLTASVYYKIFYLLVLFL